MYWEKAKEERERRESVRAEPDEEQQKFLHQTLPAAKRHLLPSGNCSSSASEPLSPMLPCLVSHSLTKAGCIWLLLETLAVLGTFIGAFSCRSSALNADVCDGLSKTALGLLGL